MSLLPFMYVAIITAHKFQVATDVCSKRQSEARNNAVQLRPIMLPLKPRFEPSCFGSSF